MAGKKTGGTRVKVVKAQVFELDPSKKHLVLVKSDGISREALTRISRRLKQEFGDVFTLALPANSDIEVVETDKPAEAPETEPEVTEEA